MGTELTVAVVGPGGLVGREILELLGQRQFPAGSIRLLGTHRTAGADVELAGRKEKIALGVVLGPLAAEAGLRRVVVSSYQGVASAGRRAVGTLSRETIDLLNARGVRRGRFARRLAFNCVPQVGALEPGGSTTHELLV